MTQVDLDEMVKKIKEFFSKINIDLFSNYLKTTMRNNVIIIYPMSGNNKLTKENLKQITKFFNEEFKMYRKTKMPKEDGVFIYEFYYDISFTINIFMTKYKDVYFLNFIEIKKFGEETETLIQAAADEILKEALDPE